MFYNDKCYVRTPRFGKRLIKIADDGKKDDNLHMSFIHENLGQTGLVLRNH